MIRVPVLLHPPIGKPFEDRTGRRGPIRRQYGLPHRKYANPLVRALLEDRFDCGGPPQTCPSRGGQQDDDSGVARFLIEVRLKGLK